jgi:hypothetical protein
MLRIIIDEAKSRKKTNKIIESKESWSSGSDFDFTPEG